MRHNQWEIQEAIKALEEDPPCVPLALRYLSKALECIQCVICGEVLNDKKPYEAYFKGYRHIECKEKRKHGTES